jgi:transcriptional regulator with XRE-family HTH domain
MKPTDLRSTRLKKGLSIDDLASGVLRPATISEIECGLRVPRRKTRIKIESLIGPIDWYKTLSGIDRQHIMHSLTEFINLDEPGARQRIKFAKQALQLIEQTLNT